MSHKDAKQILKTAKWILSQHYSGDPEMELDFEKVRELQDTIEKAERYLQDEPDDFEPRYRSKE